MRILSLLALICSALFAPSVWAVMNQGIDLTDRYIVVLKDDVSPDRVAKVQAAIEGRQGKIMFRYQHSIHGFAVSMPLPALQGLKQRFADEIAYIEADSLVEAMPRGGNPNKGGTDTPVISNQVIPWGVEAVGGPYNSVSANKAWIIDTGIDDKHPDLNVNTGLGKNFARGKPDQTSDGNGHGTHVAGTIGALDNDIDVVGIAPGVTLVPVRVLDNSGSGTMSGVIAGVDYVGANANSGDCANMSLGGSGTSQALSDAIREVASLNIIFSIAAGNSGANIENYTPAQVQNLNVYTVAAVDALSVPPYWSNFNTSDSHYPQGVNTWVEYALPGVNILSTQTGGGVTTKSGTSMAAPHLCGLVLAGFVPSTDDAFNNTVVVDEKQYGSTIYFP